MQHSRNSTATLRLRILTLYVAPLRERRGNGLNDRQPG